MIKKQTFYNMIANFVSFALLTGISFFLTPYIVAHINTEAYGYVNLANNFTSYILIVTSALNSMAGRFITIKMHQKDVKATNTYFSSVIISNAIMSAVFAAVSFVVVLFLDRIINIPAAMVWDVKILFAIIFSNFCISLITNLFSVSLFVYNKLYLGSMRAMEATILKSVFLLVSFTAFSPKVYFVAIGAAIETLYAILWNIYYTRKLLPEIRIKKQYFNWSAVKELLSSGIWNSINRLGGVLNDGLDLLISNLLISSSAMGTLAVSKTLPAMISSMVNIIAGAFNPDLTKLYAQDKILELEKTIKQSMKLLGVILSIPLGGLLVFGDVFFKLWVPSQDASMLHLLSSLAVLNLVFLGGVASLFSVFTITNQLKKVSLVTVGTSVVNTLFVFILLNTTDLGVMIIAGMSSISAILRDYIFTIPYAAKCLKLKRTIFYGSALKTAIAVLSIVIIGVAVRSIFTIDSWLSLILAAVAVACTGFGVNLYVILTKSERAILFSKVKGIFIHEK